MRPSLLQILEDTMTSQVDTWKSAKPSPLRVISAFAGNVVLRIGKILTTYKNRRAAASLTLFDDRMLADIGLTRSDLRDALSAPAWQDPTAILVSRADERRRHRRHALLGLSRPLFDAPPKPAAAPQVHAISRCAERAPKHPGRTSHQPRLIRAS
jgi:uncharacterized protein YjiS (DUF1127 family)